MGKRGPKPRGPYSGKSEVFSTRIRPDTKSALVAAAKRKGVSLSQEVEHRLKQSFVEEHEIKERFGSPEIYGIMRLVALAMHEAGTTAGFWATLTVEGANGWFREPYAYSQARKVVNRVLDAFEPPGKVVVPKQMRKDARLKSIAKTIGTGIANSLLADTASDETSTKDVMIDRERIRFGLGDHLTARLKDNIGGNAATKTKGSKK